MLSSGELGGGEGGASVDVVECQHFLAPLGSATVFHIFILTIVTRPVSGF